MNIAIIVPARIGASGGAVKHLRHLIPILLQSSRVDTLRVYLPDGIECGGSQLPANLIYTFPADDYRKGFRTLSTLVHEGKHGVALLTSARHVATKGLPSVVMAQNSEPLQIANYSMDIYWRLRLWALRREIRVAFAHATRILTLSEYMRELIISCFASPLQKIDIAYHGFDPSEANQEGTSPQGVTPEFIFTAGLLVPYRGTEDLLHALRIMRQDGGNCPQLLISGTGYSRYERKVRQLAKKLQVDDHVYWAGQLTRAEMAWCYKNCTSFIFTSRAECFSNIVLESMGHGCISISSDHPPMPEMYGDAALFYHWGDSHDLANRIRNVFTMPEEERQICRERALSRIEHFSWQQTAEQTLGALDRAICEYHARTHE